MGVDLCANCKDGDKANELITDNAFKPLDFAHPVNAGSSEYPLNSPNNYDNDKENLENLEETSKKFWEILQNKLE